MPVRRALHLAALLLVLPLSAQEEAPAPRLLTYKTVAGTELKAHVFEPAKAAAGLRSAIVLFHPGGWNAGDGTWVYPSAQRFAKLGMVAVAIDYRLSDEKSITPLDAMEDAKDAIRWVRGQAPSLRIDPKRVAAYGTSAGGHLAACAAMVTREGTSLDPAARPDALVLYSPAVAVANSDYLRGLLLGRAKPEDISPDQFVKAGLPPTFITQGNEDSVTSFDGAVRFMRRMKAAGNFCELRRYSGVGHLLTRNLDEQEWNFDPDPVARAAAWRAEEAFLASQGFIEAQPPAAESPEMAVRGLAEAFNARDLEGILRRMSDDIVWLKAEGDQARAEIKGREACRKSAGAEFKGSPSVHRELHMLATNGAFVSVRERSIWKAESGESRSQNALKVYEVEGGKIRRVWSFPAQK